MCSRPYSLAALEGHLGIGHTRYSTTGASERRNAQPVYREVGEAGFALGHNGNLTNSPALSAAAGMLPGMATTDTDVVAELLSAAHGAGESSDGRDLERALMKVLPQLEGAFSFTLMDTSHLIGVRDPNGFRPLCLGRLSGGWVLASETPALDVVGAHFVRELEPGEMVVIDATGVRSLQPVPARAGQSQAVHLRVRLLRPARQPAVRQGSPRRPPPHGRVAGRGRAGAGRHGHGRARIRRARGRGLRPAQRHPLRPGLGEEPLHRSHLHLARPRRPRPGRSAQAQPVAREHRRQAARCGRRLDRAGNHAEGGRADAARRRRPRGAPAHHPAADSVAVLLRHRHRLACRADRR